MMRRWPATMRGRLTLWYAGALSLVLVAFASVSLFMVDAMLGSRTDALLGQAGDLFGSELAAEFLELKTPAAAIAATLREVPFRDIAVRVADAQGRTLGVSGQPLLSSLPLRQSEAGDSLVTIPGREGGVRALTRSVLLDNERFTLTFLQSRSFQHETMEGLRLSTSIAILGFLLLAALGGYAIARRALAPLGLMAAHARAIGASNLHERLPVAEPGGEIGSLAQVINALLERLERSFGLQRRFVADASHELRTAVAIVRAESEIALGRPTRPEAEYRVALQVTHDAGKRLTRIVDDLLLLARADEERQAMRSEPLYLNELVTEVAAAIRALAAERRIVVEVTAFPDAPVEGDPELLSRMLLNLLDNAVKYSPAGSTVRVSLTAEGDAWRLAVTDEGPGIPDADRAAIFERFHRVEKDRSRGAASTSSGAGLGLAIARSIAEMHGGSLVLARSSSRGSEFVAIIPARAPTRPAPESGA
jgi:heavy metal sensor kinase